MNDNVEFYDIFDYYTPPFHQTTLGKICIIGSIIIITAFIVYFFIIRRRKAKLLPWEWAQKELEALFVEKCTSKDDYKKLYFRISRILKQYLQKRYFWQTEDKTDDELILYLERQKFDITLLNMLKKLVDGAQWIKFANENVLRSQAERDHATALFIVQQTRPQDVQSSSRHV